MIYTDFCDLVAAFAADNGVPVAYPGVSFTPPDTGQWLEVIWTQNGGQDVGLADDGPYVDQGFFRVLVYDRPGHSVVAAHTLAESMRAAIPKGTSIGNAYIYQTPRLSGPTEYDERFVIPVTFRYQTV